MKFVPNPAFERLNSLLGGVDNALGCRSTIRVEAFSCRKSKEEKRTAQLLAQQQQQREMQSGDSSMGFPATSFNSEPEEDDASPGNGNAAHDQRFLFLVSCLNALYGDEYDFTVLAPSAFQLCEPYAAMAEVDQLLAQMPPELLGPNARHAFWSVLGEQLAPGTGANLGAVAYPMNYPASPSPSIATECDFFKFVCPECDPTAQSKLWSMHYLIYARRSRLMVSLLAFGEGNAYRGDDGYRYGRVGSPSQAGPPSCSDSPMYYVEPDDGRFPSAPAGFFRGQTAEEHVVTEEDDLYGVSGQKNRDFWGFGE